MSDEQSTRRQRGADAEGARPVLNHGIGADELPFLDALIATDKIYQMGALDEQMRLYFGGEANRSMHLDSGRALFERRIDGDDARRERMKARFVAVLSQADRSKGYLAGRDFGGNRPVGALMLALLER